MRAVVVATLGGGGVIEVSEVPIPEAGPGPVAVDVAHARLNIAEVLARQITNAESLAL
jgi:NADPH2:quinone reductase